MASELKEAQQVIREIIPPKQRIDIYDLKNMTRSIFLSFLNKKFGRYSRVC
jgi:hypothetical protein